MATGFSPRGRKISLLGRVAALHFPLLASLLLIAAVGILMLHSTAAGGESSRVAAQTARLGVGVLLLLLAALVDARLWLRAAYPLYALALLLLGLVEFAGSQSMGAQRWLRVGALSLQPAEMMKITLVLALARYYHMLPADMPVRFSNLLVPLALIAMPILLLLRQPDLGTALILLLLGAGVLFLAGARYRYFIAAGFLGLASLPLAWQFLHAYQKQRVLTFLFPEQDPMGAGYHILQSKIALGAGGLFGRGYLRGSQNHLDFLPEKETDFIFTVLAEEMGLVGSLALMALYVLALLLVFLVAARSSSHFGRILAMGLGVNFFLHIFANIAMVTGLIPVVGMPLPLVSYGGSAMAALLLGFGLVMSVHIQQAIASPTASAPLR